MLHVSSSLPGQNGHHFEDNIFKCIFMSEKFCILIRISLKFAPKGPIDNIGLGNGGVKKYAGPIIIQLNKESNTKHRSEKWYHLLPFDHFCALPSTKIDSSNASRVWGDIFHLHANVPTMSSVLIYCCNDR